MTISIPFRRAAAFVPALALVERSFDRSKHHYLRDYVKEFIDYLIYFPYDWPNELQAKYSQEDLNILARERNSILYVYSVNDCINNWDFELLTRVDIASHGYDKDGNYHSYIANQWLRIFYVRRAFYLQVARQYIAQKR